MTSTQDASVGLADETVYKTGVTAARWFEFIGETFDWDKNVKQGKGLRVGGRVARSGRRVVPSAMGKGDLTTELAGKGFGLLFELMFGSAVSTNVSGATNQQLFTLGDTPKSCTIQKGLPQAGGSVDAYTFLGCMVDSWELDFPNADIVTLKTTWDIADLTTATGYAAPSYPSPLDLYHFAGGSITTGTLTAPTTIALASGATTVADVRGGSLNVANNLAGDRLNMGGAGRKVKPTVGLRDITGKLDIEYDSTTFRDAVLNETPMSVILNWSTGVALSTGFETLQIVLPECKFDSELAKSNATDLIIQNMAFTVLDNLVAAQPIWAVLRTSDSAL